MLKNRIQYFIILLLIDMLIKCPQISKLQQDNRNFKTHPPWTGLNIWNTEYLFQTVFDAQISQRQQ